jgi:glycosyltransferase involved in cell wall biosynthesis
VSSPIKLSLAIITLNEERNIERCIRSVPFADDVVVLDSGSQDRTVEIARRLGARVTTGPWRGYGKQKMRAAALGLHDWVLSLDADEALSEEAQKNLKEFLEKADPKKAAYNFARKTWHLGKWLKHGGCYPDRQTRLFDKNQCQWSDTEVHEELIAPSVGHIKGDILHWSFRNVAHQIDTINKYSSLRAQDLKNQGKKFGYIKLVIKPFSRFIQNYFFKLGFLDGLAGFEVAMVSSFSYFLRLIKLKELSSK